MKTLKSILIVAALIFESTITFCQTNQNNFPKLTGPYLGQKPPDNQSKIFAPEFISTKEYEELNSVFTQAGNEFYFSRRGLLGEPSQIMVSRNVNGEWIKPVPVNFTSTYSDIDLFITPDYNRMIFCSTRPHQKGEIEKRDHDFWISKRVDNKWSEPVLFAQEAASEHEDFFPIITNSGNLFFNSQRGGPGTNDIYCSRFVDGKYSIAEKLPEPINSIYREFDAYVSPDEKMIIFSSDRPGGFGRSDIYISYIKSDGNWTEPINLSTEINSTAAEYGAAILPDGKYFFFTSNKNFNENIYWIDAKFIEELRPKEDN